MSKTTFRKRLFAWILKKGDAVNHRIYGSFKKKLFHDIKGLVVEIGPGTGVNFDYLPVDTEWIGIEPNEAFHKTLLNKARDKGIHAKLISGHPFQIPLEDNIADIFICTLVLCSVPNPSLTIAEIKRVLKPNGKLILIEHVASTTSKKLLLAQNFMNPLLRFAADGCNCNRQTWNFIRDAGFSKVQLNHDDIKGTLIFHKPHILGYAIK